MSTGSSPSRGTSRLNPHAPEFIRTGSAPCFVDPSNFFHPPPSPLVPYFHGPRARPPTASRRPRHHHQPQLGGRKWSPGRSGRGRNTVQVPPRMRSHHRPKQRDFDIVYVSSNLVETQLKRIVEPTDQRRWPTPKSSRERQRKSLKPGDTTVMICNIPNKYTQMLMEFLDEHCSKENQKISDHDHERVISAYDFLYLPFDLRRRANLGYAFVNFTDPRAVEKFRSACHKREWEHCGSRKICEIAAAKMQGKDNLVSRFNQTGFVCDSPDFLPVSFNSPGRGCGQPVSQTVVGHLL